MESHHVPVAVRLVVAVCLIVGYCSGQCRFEYRIQPPSSTIHDCNPYSGNFVIIMSLECVVRRQSGVMNDYEIKWFRENTTGGVEDLGRGEPDVPQGENDWLSRYHDTKLFNQQYNPSFVGKYWCQVINTAADPDQPLMRSNVFTLLPPDNYTGGSTCPGAAMIQQIENVTCADLPVHSEQNTQSAPTHSQSTHPSTKTTCQESLECKTLTDKDISTSNTLTITNTPSSPPATTEIVFGVVLPLLLLLIACSALIMILIVMKRSRRRKRMEKQNHSVNKDIGCNDDITMEDSITQQSSETNDKANISADKQPVAYEIPVIARKERNHKLDDAHYSIVREANMSNTDNDRDNKHGVHGSIATPILDNPIYLSELVHTSEPDHQYSSLNHQLVPLIHEHGGTGSSDDTPVPASAGMVDNSQHYSSLDHQMPSTHENNDALNNPMYSLETDEGDNITDNYQRNTSEHNQVLSTHKHADSSNSPGTLDNPIYLLEHNEELNNSTGGQYSSLHHQVLTTQSSGGSTGAADGLYSKLNAY